MLGIAKFVQRDNFCHSRPGTVNIDVRRQKLLKCTQTKIESNFFSEIVFSFVVH